MGSPVHPRFSPQTLLIFVILVACSCGCIEPWEQIDLFAAKFSENGTLTWVRVIDSGRNDEGTGLHETSDGGYLITGGSYPSGCNVYTTGRITIQPYRVRLSSDGTIVSITNTSAYPGSYDYPAESFDRAGRFRLAVADGTSLSTYPMNKENAIYYRLNRTDAGGNLLWDAPFLTLKGHPSARHLVGETVIVQGIVPTSDKGYLVWGSREKVTPC